MDQNTYYAIQYLAATASFVVFLFYFGLLVINLALINVAARAARRKNRSYGAFWWLGLLLTPVATFAIVALLPFNEYDPRSPFTKTDLNSETEMTWINKFAQEPTVTRAEKAWLIIGAVSVLVAIFWAASILIRAVSGASY